MLVNDLDLRVIAPNGTTNFPWVLDPVTRTNAATAGDNNVDNVEQVLISSPTTGLHVVRITHKGSLLNDLGQTNYQNITIVLPGNIAQPPIVPFITSIVKTSSNALALKWSSEVGRVHRVQYRDDLTSGSWQYATGELSVTKTNTAATVSFSASVTNRFYRIEQIR